ncbi:MAG: hypothetical protein H7122_15365 [Chitinophagaceae bacterium]|nr:hypothetical protein [Chitinophagaceae bacterium]
MQYTTTKKLSWIRILLLVGTLLIVGIVLLDVFSSDSGKIGFMRSKGSGISQTQQEELLKVDELLHARLWQLQHMDQQFASQSTTQTEGAELSKSNASIQYMEEAFRKSIDSIERIGVNYDEESGTNDFQNMTSFFKKILENRRFLAYTRQSFVSDTKGSNDKQTILRLQNELYEKDKIIVSYANKDSQAGNQELVNLKNQITEKEKQIVTLEGQVQKEQGEKQQYLQSSQKLQNDLAEKEKMIAALTNKKGTGDQTALLNLQNEISIKNKQIGNLENQLQKGQTEKQTYTQAIQKLQTDLAEKNKIIAASANQKLPDAQKAMASLQNDVTLRLRQVSTLQAQVLKDQAEIKSYSQTIQKLQNELSQKSKQNTAATNNSATDQKTLSVLQNDINEKNKKISTMEAQMKREQTDRQSYTQTISNLQTELIEKNKLIASAGNRKVPADQKAMLTLQNEITEKDRRIRSLEEQLQSGIRTVNATNKQAGGESVRDLEQRNTNLRLAYNNTMTQLGVLQKKYNLLKTEMDFLRNQQK